MNMLSRSSRYKLLHKPMCGVTLIEMMISLTIGLIIIAGIGYAYLGSKQSFRSQDAISRMQESARTAFEIMAKDIRMVGFRGCPPNATDINVLTAKTDWDKNLIDQPLIGYEKTSGAWSSSLPLDSSPTPQPITVTRGDVLTVLHADNSKEYIVSSHNTATKQITLNANHDLQQGEILIASLADCSMNAVFQKTNTCTLTSGICGDAIVQHGSSSATTTVELGTPSPGVTFGASSRLFRLSAITYYIRNNSYGESSLYRQILGTSGTAPNNAAEELVEGVQNMQLVYGVDTTADGAVDSYVTADAVTDWTQVLGIRINLLLVSRKDEKGITTQPQQYSQDFNGDGDVADTGETVTPTDNLLRKVFTTTIAVKNRL